MYTLDDASLHCCLIYTGATRYYVILCTRGGHGGKVVTLSPPSSEAVVQFPARPQVGKLVVACRCNWSAVYSTEP